MEGGNESGGESSAGDADRDLATMISYLIRRYIVCILSTKNYVRISLSVLDLKASLDAITSCFGFEFCA